MYIKDVQKGYWLMCFLLYYKMQEKILKYMGQTLFTANLSFHTRRSSCLEHDY